jgi:hypothetical protein
VEVAIGTISCDSLAAKEEPYIPLALARPQGYATQVDILFSRGAHSWRPTDFEISLLLLLLVSLTHSGDMNHMPWIHEGSSPIHFEDDPLAQVRIGEKNLSPDLLEVSPFPAFRSELLFIGFNDLTSLVSTHTVPETVTEEASMGYRLATNLNHRSQARNSPGMRTLRSTKISDSVSIV